MAPAVRPAAILFLAALAGPSGLLGCAPRWLVASISERFPGCLYYVETAEPLVALTIDDGPDPEETAEILRVLAEQDVHATFFLIGSRIDGNEELVRAMVEGGHEIANHLMEDRPSIRLSEAEFEARLEAVDRVLEAYQPVVSWFRPGSGFYDNEMIEALDEEGYRCALGSVYPFDAQLPFSGFASRYVLRHARPGAVIVLHDGGRRGQRTVRVLERVLPALRARGLHAVTLSELAAAGAAEPHLQP